MPITSPRGTNPNRSRMRSASSGVDSANASGAWNSASKSESRKRRLVVHGGMEDHRREPGHRLQRGERRPVQIRDADHAVEPRRVPPQPERELGRVRALHAHPLALREQRPRAAAAQHAPIEVVELRIVARPGHGEPLHHDIVQLGDSGLVGVGPVDVRVRARGGHLDLVAACGHPFGELAAELFGAPGDPLAVALHDVQQTHQATASTVSSTESSDSVRSSASTRS